MNSKHNRESVARQKQTGIGGKFGHLVKGEPAERSLTAETPADPVTQRLLEIVPAGYENGDYSRAATSTITDTSARGQFVSDLEVADLLAARAKDQVYGQFRTSLNRALEDNADMREFAESYRDHHIHAILSESRRATSRSTSVVSNLHDDLVRSARAELIHKISHALTGRRF